MSDVKPRTAAGKRLLTIEDCEYHGVPCGVDAGAPCNCGLVELILAIEAEAAAPSLTVALRDLLDAVQALEGRVTGRERLDAAVTSARAALTAPEGVKKP